MPPTHTEQKTTTWRLVPRTPNHVYAHCIFCSDDCKSSSWEEKDLASMDDPDRVIALKDGTEVSASDPHGLVVILR